MRRARVVGLASAIVLVVGFLLTRSGTDVTTLPPPSSTSSTEAPQPTVPPDYGTVFLRPVGGTTTTSVATTGRATLRGTVNGPGGRVAGAVVRVERLVGDAVLRRDVGTGGDGGWALTGIPGGRYRVRAFQPPGLAQTTPELFFLRHDEVRDLNLRVQGFGGTVVSTDAAPSNPIVDEPVNVVVRVTTRSVGTDGVVRTTGASGVSVTLGGSPAWEILTSNPSTTGGDGQAGFTVLCRQSGSHSLFATVAGADAVGVPVGECTSRPSPTTTTVDEPTSTTDGPTTTTD